MKTKKSKVMKKCCCAPPEPSKWPENTMFIVVWIAIAVIVVAMAHCTYKQTQAHEEACKTKTVCVD
jgi:tryptophan-rich sensory protein